MSKEQQHQLRGVSVQDDGRGEESLVSRQRFNNTTIKYISNKNEIEVQPSEVIFNNIQQNQSYEMVAYVRNLTKKSRRIRVFQPKSACFRCDYEMQGNVAAGLAMKLVITFDCNSTGEQHDCLKVVSDNGFELEVPLHAYAKQAQILFEPFVNLGFIKVNQTKSQKVCFVNEGEIKGEVQLVVNDNIQNISVSPAKFSIDKGQKKEVTVSYTASDSGIFRGNIQIKTDCQLFQDYIEINATSVEYNRFIIDQSGDQISMVDFDYMYFGQQKEIETILVNNTPKKYKFEVKLKMGVQAANKGNNINLQTPDELGYEQTEKIMSCYPEKGVIESYSQMTIQFRCKSRIKESHRQWIKNYTVDKVEEPEEFNYSAIIDYQGDTESTVLLLQGKGIHPKVLITKTNLLFGECAQHQSRDIQVTISNQETRLPIDYQFQQNGYFHMTPAAGMLEAQSEQTLIFSYSPKNLGKFHQALSLYLNNHNYTIPLKFMGTTSTIQHSQDNNQTRRGVECLPQNFVQERNYIEGEQYQVYQRKKKRNNSINNNNNNSVNHMYSETISTIERGQDQDMSMSFNNSNSQQMEVNQQIHNSTVDRIKYFDYVRQARQQRAQQNKQQKYKQKMAQLESRINQLEQTQNANSNMSHKQMKEGKDKQKQSVKKQKQEPPIDYDFLLQDGPRGIEQPHLKLPEQKDNLYVDKHIDKYEPTIIIEDKQFVHNVNQPVKKQFHSEPRTHLEIRDCQSELSGEKLQKIRVSPQVIDFNNLFVKSQTTKSWGIKNDLRENIVVRLESATVELEQTPRKPQVIPSGQVGVFEVVLQSYRLQSFIGYVKYIINEQHEFYFKVIAEIEPVKLLLNKNSIKFGFSEESEEMETTEYLNVTNNGNSAAKFEIKQQENSVFTIEEIQGEIQAGQQKSIGIIYKPSKSSGGKSDEEKILFKTKDGQDQVIRCKGEVSETRCEFKQNVIDLKEVSVCQKVKQQLTLKNSHKYSTAFRIEMDCPYIVEIQPVKGRIGPEESKIINIIFQSNTEQQVKYDILCKIRGGKTTVCQLLANVQLPRLSILEKSFDFGGIVTLGTPGKLSMTLKNESNITASLIVDLRDNMEDQDYEGVECLDIQLGQEHADEIEVIEKLEEEVEEELEEQNNPEDLDKVSETSSIDIDGEQKQKVPRYFKINIKSNRTLRFDLVFIPREVQEYNFIIPLFLQGWEQEIPALQKQVQAVGLRPSLLMEPHEVEFKKKIITSADKLYANKQSILISNPDNKEIAFKFDTSGIDQDKIFMVKPAEGVIKAEQNLDIEVSFNPYQPGEFEKKIDLFINGQNRPYLNLLLKGKGAYPRLVFDRKEVVLPQVPCNVQTKCMFRVINDGYENLNLNCLSQDIQGSKLEITYPDGKNIGVTKKRVRIEVSFLSKKPIAFCTSLEFSDDNSRVYSIPVSGIADNSILTNNIFIQRCPDEFTISAPLNQPITLLEDCGDIDSNPDHNNHNNNNNNNNNHQNLPKAPSLKTGSVISNKSSVFLGFTPLNNQIIANNLECTTNWLNQNALINNIQSFPTDVIAQNGAQLFELLQFLSGKCPVKPAVISIHMKREQKIQVLIKQYDELLKYLTEYGACLSTIKPHYLLNYQDMCYYIKTLQDENTAFSALKLNEVKFQYLSNNSWQHLFYQMIKVYYLSRITLKQFRNIFPATITNNTLPDYYLNGSNLYNDNEIILLRWLEINYENQAPLNPKRITNFTTDLQDCQVFAAVLKNYIQSDTIDNILGLKNNVYNDEDIKFNAEKVLQALKEVGIMSYLKYQDFIKMNQIDMVLLCAQLYFQLPNYIPKPSSITFQCVLHETVFKYVELNNPTSKPISYWIKLSGDTDFEIEDQFIRIDSKQTQKVKIKFTSRISQKKHGRITFTNKKENNMQAAALVFNLESEIPLRKTEKTIEVQTQLYSCQDIKIPIKNTFTNKHFEFATFKVTIIPEPTQTQLNKEKALLLKQQKKKPNNKPNNNNNNNTVNDPPPNLSLQNIIPSFYCHKDQIKIRKGESQNFYMQYMPMSYEQHKCKIVFCDENFGEFQYEIHGKATLPESIDEIKPNQQVTVDTPLIYEYPIPFQNEQILRCKQIHENRLAQSAKYEEKDKFVKTKFTYPDSTTYEVDIQPSTPFIQLPSSLNLISPHKKKGSLDKTGGESDRDIKKKKINKSSNLINNNSNVQATEESVLSEHANKLPINLLFKSPIQTTTFTITLKNRDKTDIRIYKLVFNVSPKAIKGSMEMKCPAGEELKQEIPIVNNSEKDWVIRINLQSDNKLSQGLFSCPKELQVKKKSQGSFNLSFRPTQICQASTKLVIQNQQTNDYFEYDVNGIGEEPLAVEHFVINCVAKKPTITYIDIKNPYLEKAVQYEIETDLINVEGKQSIQLEAGMNGKYQMKVSPQVGGLYTGQITFYEKDNRNRFFWYTVCINTERPRQEKTVELISQIRKAVAFDVQLSNPLDEPATFEVHIQGDDLQGEELFMLMPHQTGIYELMFSPLKVFRGKGSVSFMNEKLGEIWYDLALISEDLPFIRLPTLKAELGKSEAVTVVLENPSKMEVVVQPVISNPMNFSVSPSDIVLAPFDSTQVKILYTPSELELNETGEVRFISEELGSWKYQVFGCGLPPTLFPTRNIYSTLLNEVSEIILFKNPFKEPIQVTIQLLTQDDKSHQAFTLLSKKKDKATLPGLSPFQIPFQFFPKEMNEFYCEIQVSMNDKINWKFPIKGVTECLSKGMNFHFKTKARVSLETQLRLQLPGLPELDKEESFDLQISNLSSNEFGALINRSFSLAAVKSSLAGPGDHLLYNLKFQPMRPFKTNIDLVITRQLGGRWIFKLALESTEPDEDDTIIIHSPLNRTSSVSFKLQNRYKSFSPFQAYFLPDSDSEFSIMPKQGELEPLGREGKNFIVSFTPVEYGKAKKGKLIIETDELYWSFIVKGTFPQYKPPNVNSSLMIDHKQDNFTIKKEDEKDKDKKKRNYVIDNIKKNQTTSPSKVFEKNNKSVINNLSTKK